MLGSGSVSRRTALTAGGAMVAAGGLPAPVLAQAPSATSYGFERGFPSGDAAQRARDDADFQRAVIAYRFSVSYTHLTLPTKA